MKKSRYSVNAFRSLGYSEDFRNLNISLRDENAGSEISDFVLGQFKTVAKILFDSNDGGLDYNPMKYINDNSPEIVKRFAQQVLLCDVQAFRAAPDDDTAFDMIVPRQLQTSAELSPYLDKLKSYISDQRAAAMSADTSVNSSDNG